MKSNKADGANFLAFELRKVGDTFNHRLNHGCRLESDKVPQNIFGEMILDGQSI